MRNDRGELTEKRWVKFPGSLGHGYYDPDAISPEWNQWLRKVRDAPPTEDDIAQYTIELCVTCQLPPYDSCDNVTALRRTVPLLLCCRAAALRHRIRQKAGALQEEEAKRRFQVIPAAERNPSWIIQSHTPKPRDRVHPGCQQAVTERGTLQCSAATDSEQRCHTSCRPSTWGTTEGLAETPSCGS